MHELQNDIDQVLRKHGMILDGGVTFHLTGEEMISRYLERSSLTETREDTEIRIEFNAKILGEWSEPS